MKSRKFKVPIFEYDIQFIEIESKKDVKKIKKIFKKFTIEKSTFKSIVESVKLDRVNGGMTFWNHPNKKGKILIYKHTSKKHRLNTLGHEKCHIENRIIELYKVKDDESLALLSGYLTQKLFKKWKRK